MPIKTYRGITLRNKVVERLETIADKTNRTVPEVIEHMLDTQYPERTLFIPAYTTGDNR